MEIKLSLPGRGGVRVDPRKVHFSVEKHCGVEVWTTQAHPVDILQPEAGPELPIQESGRKSNTASGRTHLIFSLKTPEPERTARPALSQMCSLANFYKRYTAGSPGS